MFGLRVGFSDHTIGILGSQAAVSLGACVLEKHFTDCKSGRTFRDHHLSADPEDFRELTRQVRLVETLLGKESKEVQPGEEPNRIPMRRSIGVRHDLPVGTVLAPDHLIALRPGNGWPAQDVDDLVGRVLSRPLQAGDLLREQDLIAP